MIMKMKVKMRQVFGILLSLVLVLGLMPGISVNAESNALFGSDVLWVGGVSLKTNGQSTNGDSGTATLSGTVEAPVLTLDNYNLPDMDMIQVMIIDPWHSAIQVTKT